VADVAYWEARFVKCFVIKEKQDRYLAFLKGKKHRKKITDRLNHQLDFDEAKATRLDSRYKAPPELVSLLRSYHVEPTCFLIADGAEFDGHELRLELGVENALESYWGVVILCPPEPLAIYKAEDPADLILLRSQECRR
jgi:hypothetical protein